MKKLSALFAIAVILGVGTSVFAQPVPRGAEMAASHRLDMALRGKLTRDVAAAQIVNKILQKGERTPISYAMEGNSFAPSSSQGAYRYTKSYSKNGQVTGVEYQEGNTNYILLTRSVWEEMYDECMPCGFNRMTGKSIVSQTIKTTKNTYNQKGNSLLNHTHYKVNGQEYTVITFKN